LKKEIEIDFSEYERAVNRAYNMGEIRRRDIADVFRRADRPLVSAAKRNAPKGRKDVKVRSAARSHTKGNLRRGIGFAVSKKSKLVYYVRSKAWYTQIVVVGHGSYGGNRFMARAMDATLGPVTNQIKEGLMKLTQKVWQNG
jgi:hypothetical protein